MTFIYKIYYSYIHSRIRTKGITKTSREKQTVKRRPKTGLRLREQLVNYSYLDPF